MSDDFHTGRVKWLGRIGEKVFAACTFEEKIGNNTDGFCQGEKLFDPVAGYDRFPIPVCELIKYDDYAEL